MNEEWKFEVDLNILFKYNLSLESYLILYCLSTKNKELISSYVQKCKKISTDTFIDLRDKGLINIEYEKDSDKIYFDLLSLASNGESAEADIPKNLLGIEKISKEDLERQFGEFRKIYPSSIKRNGIVVRRLHGDLSRCRKLYEKLLMETTHDILCKSAKLYINEKYRSKSEDYIQNMASWLHQKNYKEYEDDINPDEDIDLLNNTSLTDDI